MNQFKRLREQNNYIQEFVAKELGVTQGAISQWEKGETFPKTELLSRIAKLYKCTVDDLLNEEEKEGAAV